MVVNPGELRAAVVVASRNRPEQLRLTLDAIGRVVPEGTDVLVVDSASDSSETGAAAEAGGARCVRADRPGVSVARNLGARSTERDVVVFTDDDCIPRPGWLEAMVAPFEDPQVAFVTGRVEGTGEGSAADVADLGEAHWGWPDDPAHMGTGGNMAFRRQALLDIGGFDPDFGGGGAIPSGEEQELFLRLLHAGWTGRHAPGSAVEHHDSRGRWSMVRVFYVYGIGAGVVCGRATDLDRAVGRRMLRTRLWRDGVRRVAADARRGWEIPALRGAAMTTGVVVGWARSRISARRQP